MYDADVGGMLEWWGSYAALCVNQLQLVRRNNRFTNCNNQCIRASYNPHFWYLQMEELSGNKKKERKMKKDCNSVWS